MQLRGKRGLAGFRDVSEADFHRFEGCVDLRIEEQLNANLSDPDDRKEVAKSGVQPFRQARIDLRQADRGLVLQPFEVGNIYPRETMEMRHFELFRSLGQPLGQS